MKMIFTVQLACNKQVQTPVNRGDPWLIECKCDRHIDAGVASMWH